MEPDIAPLAKRLAEENNVEWRRLTGSGPDGKIVERDVLEYLARVMAGEEALNPTSEPTPEGMEAWPEEDIQAFQQDTGDNVGLDGLRAEASQGAAIPPAPPLSAPKAVDLDDDLLLEMGSDSPIASDDSGLLDFDDATMTPPVSEQASDLVPPSAPADDLGLDDDLFLFDSDDVVLEESPPTLVESDIIFDTDAQDVGLPESVLEADQDSLDFDLSDFDSGAASAEDVPVIDPLSPADLPSLETSLPDLAVGEDLSLEADALSFDEDLPPLPELDLLSGEISLPDIDDGIDLGIANESALSDFNFEDTAAQAASKDDMFEVPAVTPTDLEDVSLGLPSDDLEVPSLEIDDMSAPALDTSTGFDDVPIMAVDASPSRQDEPALFEDDIDLAAQNEPLNQVQQAEPSQAPSLEAMPEIAPVAEQPIIPHVVEMEKPEDHIIDEDLPLVTYGTLLRRHIDVSALAEAQAAVGYELGLEDPLEPAPFLVRAAAKVFNASGFGQGDTIALAVISAKGMGTKAIRAANVPFKNVVSASLEAIAAEPLDIEFSDLVVADMSHYDVDEAVLNVRSPVLTLGRIMYDSDGHYKSTLSLSGDFPTQQGAEFLSRVAELLDQPIRLTL